MYETPDEARWLDAQEHAHSIGLGHGRNAATFAYDGNTPRQWYADRLDEIENGDPAMDDWMPQSSPLSGEWADDYSTTDLATDLGIILDESSADAFDDMTRAYEDGFFAGYLYEMERACRAYLS